MAEPGDDLNYIADLINGNQPSSGRGARRSRRTSATSRGGAQQVNSGRGSKNNRNSVNRHATTSPAGAPLTSSQAEDEDHKYNQPSEQSTNKVLHCPTCDVWVPSRPGDWDVHIAGIRHRRHVLSLREHGERGRLVLSAFESDPRAGETTHRISGKASGAEFGLDGQGGGSGSGFHKNQGKGGKKGTQQQEDPEYAELKALHTEAMTRCLGIYGRGHIYNVVDKFLNIDRLREAKSTIDELYSERRLMSYYSESDKINDRVEILTDRMTKPAIVLYVAHKLRQEQKQDSKGSSAVAVPTLSAAAAGGSGGAANRGQHGARHRVAPDPIFTLPPLITISMRSYMYGSDETAYIAAWMCSLQSFIHALAEHPNQVTYLSILVDCDLRKHLWPTIQKGWDRIKSDLENVLLAKNAKLNELDVYYFASAFDNYEMYMDWDYNPFDDVDASMYENMEEEHLMFEKKAKETADNVRLAILMSQHPRLGRCSLLNLLPTPIIAQIVKQAVPKEGCGVSTGRTGLAPRLELKYNKKTDEWDVFTRIVGCDYDSEERNSEDEDGEEDEEEDEEYDSDDDGDIW